MKATQKAQMPAALATRFSVSDENIQRLNAYVDLLLHWQKRVNLIGPDTVGAVWERHIADSLHIAGYLKEYSAVDQCFMDFGTGAGLPGIPMAIQSGQFVHLVESNHKKAAFLREAARVTGIECMAHACRISDIDSETLQPPPTVIVARALAPLEKLMIYTSPWLTKGGVGLFLKGQHVDKELTAATKYWNMEVEKLPADLLSDGVVLKITNTQAKSET